MSTKSLGPRKCRSRYGNFWLGTFEDGIIRFDPNTGKSFFIKKEKGNPNSLSHDTIYSLYEDKEGALWIGTGGGGLSRYNYEKGGFKHYTVKDGLPNNTVYDILEDDSGCLWMSTNNGLARFDKLKETFTNFGVQDGLQHTEFNSGASFKGRDGVMYFGGINGISRFYPDRIKETSVPPEIVILSLKYRRICNSCVPTSAPTSMFLFIW